MVETWPPVAYEIATSISATQVVESLETWNCSMYIWDTATVDLLLDVSPKAVAYLLVPPT